MRTQVVVGLSTMTIAVVVCGCENRTQAPPMPVAAMPTPRAGLWRESTLRDGHELGLIGEMRACLDADVRARLSTLGGQAGKSRCETLTITHDAGGGYHFSSACDLGPGGRVVTRGEITGDLASRYRVTSRSDTSGAVLGSMNGHHEIDLEANYLGPCPAGMRTGDIVVANGMKVNMNHLRAVAEAFGGGGG
jgi:hypothetical protein